MNTTSHARIPVAALAGLLLVTSACRSNPEDDQTVAKLVRHGEYAAAYDLAEKQAAEDPEDEAAQETLEEMRTILVLEKGRRLLFAGQPTEALGVFEGGLVFAPAHETLTLWIEKTKRQLADEWLDIAQELATVSTFDEAGFAYEKVLEYQPENTAAKDGLYRITLREQYRLGLGREYYTKGLEDLHGYQLWSADRNMGNAQHYDPDHERADLRRTEVRGMLAQERLAQAGDLEEKGLFSAARNEFRLVLLIAPDNETAQAGLDRMDNEVRAEMMLSEAELLARRGEFEEAEEILTQGMKFTALQNDAYTLLMSEVEEARLHAMYDEAISLYKDQLFPEAVAAFDRLLAQTESFEDAISRRRTLQEFITNAGTLYQEALALETEDPVEALAKLREIDVFWTEYEDVQERIAALEKQLGEDDV